MSYSRSWRILFRKSNASSQKQFKNHPFIILEPQENKEVLHLEGGTITELSLAEYDIIKDRYVKLLDTYGCLGVYNTPEKDPCTQEFNKYLVCITERVQVGKLPKYDVFRITGVTFICLNRESTEEYSYSDLKKLLSSGAFFYGRDNTSGLPYDLTRSAQSCYYASNSRKQNNIWGTSDYRYLWNRGLMAAFSRVGIYPHKWCTPIICGFFSVVMFYSGINQARLGIVSRVSAQRPGTRFNVRGVIDEGYVANFVETEFFICLNDQVISHVQIRGTVPLFWEQPGLQVGSHKIKLMRSQETSMQAFNRHFSEILLRYGETIIVNLLGSKEGELNLSNAYKQYWNASNYKNIIDYFRFDYHAMVNERGIKSTEVLLNHLNNRIDKWGYFHFDGNKINRFQTGIVRTNCVDCLDRTNAVQTLISLTLMLYKMLHTLDLIKEDSTTKKTVTTDIVRGLWQENGDNLSRIYTGTGALSGDRSRFKNAQRSATRTIQNNFFDTAKQEAMLALLNQCSLSGYMRAVVGQIVPKRLLYLPPIVLTNILKRNTEFTRKEKLKVFVGTWNVNGGKTGPRGHKDHLLCDWLFNLHKTCADNFGYRNQDASPEAFDRPTDIYAIGFEEIIDLTASNVVAGKQSSEAQKQWLKKFNDLLDANSPNGERYILLSTTQLVGVCLFVFIRFGLCEYVQGLSSGSLKTGMRGNAGNKGAVAVRFEISGTSLCFLCCHLTAGQSAVNERNAEFGDIIQRLSFSDKRNLLWHDYVFWFGDMNYRINLPNEETKMLIGRGNWLDLLRSDQLNLAREARISFVDEFSEGPVRFPPTYKYDLFCDIYDTSEKQRCPAWTDRILFRQASWFGKLNHVNTIHDLPLAEPIYKSLLVYNRADLKTSDHRPVGAIFDIDLLVIDLQNRRQVSEEEILKAGPCDATARIEWSSSEGEVEANDIYQSIVELATSSGTVLSARFKTFNQLLLTFSSPNEAVEVVRCLNGNKVSVESAMTHGTSVNVSLSVCLDSTPSLCVYTPDHKQQYCRFLEHFKEVEDVPTRQWLTDMNDLVEEGEDEYLRTHGNPPPSTIFHRNYLDCGGSDNLKINSQQHPFNLSEEDEEVSNNMISPRLLSRPLTIGDESQKQNSLSPDPGATFPDLSIFGELVPPHAGLHSVASCGDLTSAVVEKDSVKPSMLHKNSSLLIVGGKEQNYSCNASPVRGTTLMAPIPPRRPPPRPSQQPNSQLEQPQQTIADRMSIVSQLLEEPLVVLATTSSTMNSSSLLQTDPLNSLPAPLIPERLPPPLPARAPILNVWPDQVGT